MKSFKSARWMAFVLFFVAFPVAQAESDSPSFKDLWSNRVEGKPLRKDQCKQKIKSDLPDCEKVIPVYSVDEEQRIRLAELQADSKKYDLYKTCLEKITQIAPNYNGCATFGTDARDIRIFIDRFLRTSDGSSPKNNSGAVSEIGSG